MMKQEFDQNGPVVSVSRAVSPDPGVAVVAGQPEGGLAYCVISPPQLVAKPVPIETESGVEVRYRDGDGVDLPE